MYEAQFAETRRYWLRWISQRQYQGRWREHVQRSALVLKLLTYAPTGAIVAAPTTSLPEGIGGERNWDYRFTWFRDASFTLDSLLGLGFTEEAEAFIDWLKGRLNELQEGGELQPIYTIRGGHEMPEIHLDHLDGYCQSRPVRIGNGAATQRQQAFTHLALIRACLSVDEAMKKVAPHLYPFEPDASTISARSAHWADRPGL